MSQVILFLADNTQIRTSGENLVLKHPVLLPRDIFNPAKMSVELDSSHLEYLPEHLNKAYKDFKSLKLRYPLYLIMDESELELIAQCTRLGALPFMGECLLYTREENESKWEEITENLRELFGTETQKAKI